MFALRVCEAGRAGRCSAREYRGFEQFLLRGNVVDMAVGIVIGAGFLTVVRGFVKDLLPRSYGGGWQAGFLAA